MVHLLPHKFCTNMPTPVEVHVLAEDDEEDVPPSPPSPPKIVSKSYLPSETNVTLEHVKSVLGERSIEMSADELSSWMEKIERERQEVRSWAKNAVSRVIVDEARVQGLDATTILELGKRWREDGSDVNGEKLWHCFFGIFDRDRTWARKFEKNFMELTNVVYSTTPSRRRVGCYEQLITHVKNNLVKGLNKAAAPPSGHGRKIGITRSQEEINEVNRFKKRPKGVFQPSYLSGEPEKKHEGTKNVAYAKAHPAKSSPDEETDLDDISFLSLGDSPSLEKGEQMVRRGSTVFFSYSRF